MTNYSQAPRVHVPDLRMTPAEFGFVSHQAGPALRVGELALPAVFSPDASRQLHTQHMTTDQGNEVLLTSAVGLHAGITRIAANVDPNQGNGNQFSDEVQGYFLKTVKTLLDDPGAGIKTVSNNSDTIYYNGNVGTSNGRLLRVYLASVGEHDGIPVVAKVGASRTKESELKLLKALGTNVSKKIR